MKINIDSLIESSMEELLKAKNRNEITTDEIGNKVCDMFNEEFKKAAKENILNTNMNRLTQKEKFGYSGDCRQICLCSDKLGKYEDIDEEIGIDYITLNKLRTANKIYVKFFDEIQEWNKFKIDLRYCKIYYGYNHGKGYGLNQPLSNYGKGFAITRKELANELREN